MRPVLLALLPTLLGLLPAAQGFVWTWKKDDLPPWSYTWTMPADPTSTEGLGGGITYAIDDHFCDNILPQFEERSQLGFEFVDCGNLKAAINRAFHTWADNHPAINFYDVTNKCLQQQGSVAGCDINEVYIATDGSADEDSVSGERAAFVKTKTQWGYLRHPSGEVIQTHRNIYSNMTFSANICWYLDSTFCGIFHSYERQAGSTNTLLTVGRALFGVIWGLTVLTFLYQTYRNIRHQLQTAKGTLDESKKRKKRKAAYEKKAAEEKQKAEAKKKAAEDAAASKLQSIARGRKARKSVAAALKLDQGVTMEEKLKIQQELDEEKRKADAAHAVAPTERQLKAMKTIGLDDAAKKQREAFLDFLTHMNTSLTILRLVLLLVPPVFYVQLLRPCYECYDFESAVVHEIGHLLGLGHPDQHPEALLTPGAPMDNTTCHDPVAHLVTPPEEEWASMGDALYTTMMAFTQNPTEVCITDDDLAAINFLYPVCEGAQVPPASCFKSERNIGWLRFAVWVLVPLLIVMLMLLCIVAAVKRHQRQKLGSFAVKLNKMSEQNEKLLKKLNAEAAKAASHSEAQQAEIERMQAEIASCQGHMKTLKSHAASEVKSQRKASVAARASDGRKQSLFAGFSADLLGKPKKTAGFAKVRAAVRMSHAEDEAKPAASSSM
jgi:hypothetical protein